MIRQEIIRLIQNSIQGLQKEKRLLKFETPEILVERPEEKMHGDYAVGIALQIAKDVKMNPIKVAEMIKLEAERVCQRTKLNIFEKIEVAQPGFINFFLTKEYLIQQLHKALQEKERYGSSEKGKNKIVVIDYSSPNIAKLFGVGHLRSTIIGQALYNIYKFLGWKVIGDNHLGDWGTQFGKLIYQIRDKGLKGRSQKEKAIFFKDLTIQALERLYVDFHKESQINPKLEEKARNWFKKLEQGDKETKEIWQVCCNISLKEFDKIYALLGIKIDYCLGESFYQDKMKPIIEDAAKKGISRKSQGALVIPLPGSKIPFMLLKSDGATTYGTRDLAAIKYRMKKWKPNLIIYEVGADQKTYFEQLFKTAEILNYGKKEQFIHIAHGLTRRKHGKFSTRKGQTIHLEGVIKEAIEKAGQIIERSETSRGLSKQEKKKVAMAVGIGAIKYNDLSQHYSRDIIFDWNKILNLKGNSAPYIQYTFARCRSVLKKTKAEGDETLLYLANLVIKKKSDRDFNREESELLRMICKFPEIIEEAAVKFSPNLICNFAFDLAKEYNLFYNLHQIIKAETKEKRIFRLALTCAVAQTLKNALSLLGIFAPEKM